ncbi:MAG: tRNA (N6-isopentenyl adenosine(37)-C2)-methylthiotransferase MiaB [Oscillospiraceae bacterium]|jgi:tRNA-2-methylthio-N6-dimethylallyladenosine synthase|nr:tRNA (N6-isopentenyl adenosine(37)-C2)-methylthiotransferase MiaB [Oscillospiraceae bacterium]
MPQEAAGRIPEEMLQRQREFAALLCEVLAGRFGREPRAFVRTFGCQGNEADSERICGILESCGFVPAQSPEDADFILYNTCAVREHAEDRALGNIGRLKQLRQTRRGVRIGLCGCMVQQPHVAARLRESYPFIDLVFGTHAVHLLPELLYRLYDRQNDGGDGRVFEVAQSPGAIAEGLPVRRGGGAKAWLPVMYGCDNFCSYCVVPLVRGRERSRQPERILEEAREIIASGGKEITLLGQNVNSYHAQSESGEAWDFPRLLRALDALPGDYWLRFMTSHPKDCSPALLEAMAAGKHIARHLHLPLQSGNDRVLREMNRGYTAAQYLAVAEKAREFMPGLSMTSDVIVGFPGETEAEFDDTLRLVEQVGYTSLFTFIFSPREGTRAARMDDPTPHAEKARRFQALTALQEGIAARRSAELEGQTLRLLCEGKGKRLALAGRSEGNKVVEFNGSESLTGQFVEVRITRAQNWLLDGEIL